MLWPYVYEHHGLLLEAWGQCLYEPPRPEHNAAVRGLMPPLTAYIWLVWWAILGPVLSQWSDQTTDSSWYLWVPSAASDLAQITARSGLLTCMIKCVSCACIAPPQEGNVLLSREVGTSPGPCPSSQPLHWAVGARCLGGCPPFAEGTLPPLLGR